MKNKCDECARDSVCKGKCEYHYRMPSQINPKPLAKAKTKSIAHFSVKKLAELKVYQKLRDEFLKGKTCQYPGCISNHVVLHHAAGRIGANLIAVRHFRSLCDHHHRIVEDNPTHARELNLSVSRLS